MFQDKKVTAIITAAGKGSRMKASLPKQFLALNGRTILENAIEPFQKSSHVDDILVVAGKGFEELCREKCSHFSKVRKILTGGKERQDSVDAALRQAEEGYVLIHDGARPYVTGDIIDGVLEAASKTGAAVPCVPVKESVRQLCSGEKEDSDELRHNAPTNWSIDRSSLYTVQTPQCFETGLIKEAFRKAYEDGFYGTDDASLVDRLIAGTLEAKNSEVKNPETETSPIKITAIVTLTEGSSSSIKITAREDWPLEFRAGSGYDVHRLAEGRKLILCGEEITFEKGLLGHSDADVAVHALMDAMLGAAGLGDIGRHFPDTDMKYKDISSMKLLKEVKALLEEKGWTLNNADITIMAQRPKLLPHIEKMKLNVAEALEKDVSCINVKATTTEKLGFVGREEGIAAEAVCILTRN